MMLNKKKLIVEIGFVVILVSLVHFVRISRGNPPALEIEPTKVKGLIDAPVSLVEFSDYSCPYCRKIQPILYSYISAFPDDLKIVFKHYPIHKLNNAGAAAEAAECAGDQGQFWAYSDMLFLNPGVWLTEDFNNRSPFPLFAKKLNLNLETFQTCLDSGAKKETIERNIREGRQYLITGTPTCILNGQKILAQPSNIEKTTIEISRMIKFTKENKL